MFHLLCTAKLDLELSYLQRTSSTTCMLNMSCNRTLSSLFSFLLLLLFFVYVCDEIFVFLLKLFSSGCVCVQSLVVDTWFQGLLERTDEETSRVLITDEGEVSKRAAPVQLAVADTKTTSPFPLSVQDNPSDGTSPVFFV